MPSVTNQQLESVVGSFPDLDADVFRVLLTCTGHLLGGDLAEMGVLYGRSAILVGDYVSDGESFTIVDLFDGEAGDAANAEENSVSYPGLTQQAFERNYRLFHAELPVIVKGFSHEISRHVRAGTHRFVHIDASHLYEHVVGDLDVARDMLKGDGVVVLDDFRQEHTPGVAAAAWQAVTGTGLRPFALTPQKMYATWGDPERWREELSGWAARTSKFQEVQVINGLTVLRLREHQIGQVPQHPLKRYFPRFTWPMLAWLNRRLQTARRR